MENNEINNLLKEALKEHAEKNNITTEVLYDEAMGDNGKISIWKSLKSYWKPKNWLNYQGYVSREKYWKTILGNLILMMGLSIPILIFYVAFAIAISSALNSPFFGLFFLIFTPLILNGVFLLSFNALLMKRANCAGIDKMYVWGGYFLPSIINLILYMAIPSQIPASISFLLGVLPLGTWIIIGLIPNKFLEYRKVSALAVISKE